jgi:hypothetical protein
MLAGLAAAGVGMTVGGEAEASEAPRQIMALGLAFAFIWNNVLDDDDKATIKQCAHQAVASLKRAFGGSSESVAAIGGGNATIVFGVRKQPDGHLAIAAHMDHNGQRAFAHQGSAPHRRHPDLQAHCNQIAGKAHLWLSARGM